MLVVLGLEALVHTVLSRVCHALVMHRLLVFVSQLFEAVDTRGTISYDIWVLSALLARSLRPRVASSDLNF